MLNPTQGFTRKMLFIISIHYTSLYVIILWIRIRARLHPTLPLAIFPYFAGICHLGVNRTIENKRSQYVSQMQIEIALRHLRYIYVPFFFNDTVHIYKLCYKCRQMLKKSIANANARCEWALYMTHSCTNSSLPGFISAIIFVHFKRKPHRLGNCA